MYPAKPTAAAASEPAAGMAPPVTGIPISSPIHGAGAGTVAASQWSSGLCACFDDCGLCKHPVPSTTALASKHLAASFSLLFSSPPAYLANRCLHARNANEQAA